MKSVIGKFTLGPIKREHQTFRDNSVESQPIFKICALLKSEGNFLSKYSKKIAPGLIYVATLPWETLKFKFL